MHRYKQFISLGIVFLGSISFLDVAHAQTIYVPNAPAYPDMCSYREATCRRDSDGNIVDRETGDLYDKKGHLIRRNAYPPEQSTEESSDDVPLKYGAISRSFDTRRYAWVWGYDDYEAAENAADQQCGVSDCDSLFFGNGFGAIAATSDHWTVYEADTPEQAAQDALEDCRYYSEIPDTCEVILIVGSKEGTIFQK
jgi:hypothetical protein